jgi:hypothetical protein
MIIFGVLISELTFPAILMLFKAPGTKSKLLPGPFFFYELIYELY